jgi:hypothetical protein
LEGGHRLAPFFAYVAGGGAARGEEGAMACLARAGDELPDAGVLTALAGDQLKQLVPGGASATIAPLPLSIVLFVIAILTTNCRF